MTDDRMDALIQEAQSLGGHTSKSATVNAALAFYVERHKEIKPPSQPGTDAIEPE
jgi:ferritin-like metal-binding protein YciE